MKQSSLSDFPPIAAYFYAALTLMVFEPNLYSQIFSSGSNGSYGPIDIPENEQVTLDMPTDGIFHATTITIGPAASLSFKKNAGNTPVYLLATGDVVIEGTISVRGQFGVLTTQDSPEAEGGAGGPGGYDGGAAWILGRSTAGMGQGPGGGRFGEGSFRWNGSFDDPNAPGHGNYGAAGPSERPANGATYGSELLIPLVGGSGGGGVKIDDATGLSGGGGGGAILIASNTSIRHQPGSWTGQILAIGGASAFVDNSGAGYGCGGAVRLVAPKVEGTGVIRCDNGVGGLGRIRIDAIDVKAMQFTTSGVTTVGGNMVVFPPNFPELKIVEAGGQMIDPESLAPVTVLLPNGEPSTQPVKVQARNFNGTAKINVALTPKYGERVVYPLDIDNPGPDPAVGTVNVEFEPNMLIRVDVWTR